MLDHSCQVQRHAYAERGHDLYGTPVCGTRNLLQVEKLPLAMRESARPTYVLRLRAAGGDTDAIRALRGLLKTALRRFGLRAISICEEPTRPSIYPPRSRPVRNLGGGSNGNGTWEKKGAGIPVQAEI